MRDGALKWALRLLGLALAIGPILIAFSMNNWDLRATVLPSDQELGQVQDQLTQSVFGGGISEDTLTYGSPITSGNNVTVPITFRSPLNISGTILSFDVGIDDQGIRVAELHLQDGPVHVPANGTVEFDLAGTYQGEMPANPQIGSLTVTFEVYGVTVRISGMAEGQSL